MKNSQSYITKELVHIPDRTKETAREKLKLSLTSKKVRQNNGNSQWHSLDKLVNKIVQRREQRESREGSHILNIVYM